MAMARRIVAIVGIAAVGLALAACSRKITRVEVVQSPQSCFQCHSDVNTFLVAAEQQWENSRHASGRTVDENFLDCKGCHTSEGFVARATGTTAPSTIEKPTAIHCFTCHAPHSEGGFGVRWTAEATLQNGATYPLNGGNLCVACHRAGQDVRSYVPGNLTLVQYWGPHHGVQGDVFLGSNGYEYAGYDYESSEHREPTTENGKDGCLECHMKKMSQNKVGGHSFNMAWPWEGAPTILNTAACEPCHGELLDFNRFGVQDEISGLIADLATRLEQAGLWQGGVTGDVKVGATATVGQAGAVWNLLLAREDRSRGVHNPEYVRALLQSSISHLQGALPPRGLAARK